MSLGINGNDQNREMWDLFIVKFNYVYVKFLIALNTLSLFYFFL